MSSNSRFYLLFTAWVVALVSTLGSLFFSEVMSYVPCSLCWYQRIFMYPLVLVLGLALSPLDAKVTRYAIPLALTGWGFAFYHNLLHWKLIPEGAAPCKMGVPCSVKYIDWFGFVSIPLLSLLAFTFILICLLKFREKSK